MCDVRLIDNIKRTSGINLEGPSLIRRSQKVWDPPKKWSNCANVGRLTHRLKRPFSLGAGESKMSFLYLLATHKGLIKDILKFTHGSII